MTEMPDILPNRLNFDAIVFCGCTMKEMQVIAIFSLVTCIFLFGSFTKALFDMFLIGTGLAFPAAVGMSWGIALVFQRTKQGKPKGYLKQRILLCLEDYGLMPAIYIRRSGKWSVGRTIT